MVKKRKAYKNKKEINNYSGSIVLGLNDALVELTGALAGLTFALRNTKVIAVTGLITGIAAALSMATSEYLSSREEEEFHYERNPSRSALYTGVSYFITVLFLVIPYFIFENVFNALTATFVVALLVILFYTYYISNIRKESFAKRFFEMVGISLGVAVISFIVGILLRIYVGIEL